MIKKVLAAAMIVWGFGHADVVGAAGISSPTAQLTPVAVTEYYNESLDHYFMTADAAEATALDSGVHPGWARTGYAFTAYTTTSSGSGVSSVCRFYGRPQ